MQITMPVVKVLATLLTDPDTGRYGLDLMRATGLASGTLYPVLHRLREAGWVDAAWEDVDPSVQGRPARRYYRLTGEGVRSARLRLAELHAVTGSAANRGPATGLVGPDGSGTGIRGGAGLTARTGVRPAGMPA